MDWKSFFNEFAITIALLTTILGIIAIVIVSGSDSLGPTRLVDVALALVGALAGTKIPR